MQLELLVMCDQRRGQACYQSILMDFISATATTMYLLLAVAGLASLYLVGLLFSRTSRILPPGPKPLPIIGNVRDMPASGSPDWVHWLEHKELYGTRIPRKSPPSNSE